MNSQSAPSWRSQQPQQPPRHSTSSVPRKRAADAAEDAWVAEEDQFVLRQAKKKAAIRVKAGRARPIDWLAVTLRAIDTSRKSVDLDEDDEDIDIVDPEGVFEGLSQSELLDLSKDVDTYITLELDQGNRDFWATMKVICKDRLERFQDAAPVARGVNTVTGDIDRMLAPKSYEELESLEKQIRIKLKSNEPIDFDYWEHLLRTLLVWKARARLRKVSHAIVKRKMQNLHKQQIDEARALREKLKDSLQTPTGKDTNSGFHNAQHPLDPDPLLKIRSEDKALEVLDLRSFLRQLNDERRKVAKLGFVPMRQQGFEKSLSMSAPTTSDGPQDVSRTADALRTAYDREVARGVDENEEVFAGEEQVDHGSKPKWADKYRPRKPKYFNRVQMGYEWNKYNQTHYDHDNPPPKVVQGYKFNIFYPDLIDVTKAPTYKILREGGRKRGQSFAAAGEDDTCVIRFIAGPPYEDIAFRIVDKEWDYSAKRERGFRSSFEKGVLQLHFQFKKIYYRK